MLVTIAILWHHSKTMWRPKSWKRFFFIVAGVGVGCIIIGALVLVYYIRQVPDTSLLALRRVNESTKIYDRSETTILFDVHGEEKRTIIAWEQMPPSIKNAILAAEDSSFYKHGGIDIRGIARALYNDIKGLNASEGGSTITQQLVKNAIVGKQKSISRKIKEAILALQVERAYSKDYIFWTYLNQIPFGSNTYGIEAASQTFFGKHAEQLTIAEAAMLASVIKAPTYYSPYGNHTDQLTTRSTYILGRMKNLGTITTAEYDNAIANPPQAKSAKNHFAAAHFVIMVRDYLIQKYGEDLVENGGLKVITTLDKDKQDLAEELVTKYGDINAKKYKADNAALVAVDPRTGQLLALVGSRDYWDIEHSGNYNVAIQNIRQPGSSFKPFAYATAFAKGYGDSTILFDLRTEFNPLCNPSGDQVKASDGSDCYHPKDYSGTFSGPVSLRQALGRSLNVPAVKILYLAGITDTVETARSMGVLSLDPVNYYGLSLVLGGAGVSLVDMVSGYGVFANDGIHEPSTFILKVTSSDGVVLEEFKQQEEQVIAPQVARMISDVLSDNNARAPAFGYSNSLTIPGRQIAAKTGTTQNNRDGWLIGYAPSLAAGVWTGNNDDSPMTAAGAGASAAGPMWNEFMRRALQGTPVEFFTKPDPIAESDKPMFNGDYHDADGSIHTILKYIDQTDPQYRNWEASVETWIRETGQIVSGSLPLF